MDELERGWRDTSSDSRGRAEEEFGQERAEELERLRVAAVEAREAALRADEEKFRAYADAQEAHREALKPFFEIHDRLVKEELEAKKKAFQAEMEELEAKGKAEAIERERFIDEIRSRRREWVQ